MPRSGNVTKPAALFTPLVVAFVALALTGTPASAGSPTSCTKVAAPYGSDSAAGSEIAPYRTVQRLVSELDAGETGCLRTGTYGGKPLYMREPDTALQSYPGERATLTAFLEVTPEAPRSRVSGLTIDTSGNSNGVGTKLQADDAVLSDNVITKGNEGICVLAGTYNPAQRVIIERNYIYDCSSAVTPEGTHNKWDHAIYLSDTRNAIVRWNIIHTSPGGWGVHLYPGADGTLIEHNIIDGNQGGVIFAGDGEDDTSDDNLVRNNAITGNGPRWNIEASWSGGPAGTGNVATGNCVYSTGPNQPSGIPARTSFSVTGNTVLDDLPYVDSADGDYRFKPGSPCGELVGDVVAAVNGETPSTPPKPTPAVPAPAPETTPPPPEATPPASSTPPPSSNPSPPATPADGGVASKERAPRPKRSTRKRGAKKPAPRSRSSRTGSRPRIGNLRTREQPHR